MKILRLFALLTILPLGAFAGPFSNGSFEQAGITGSNMEVPLTASSTDITGWAVKVTGTLWNAADDFSATENTDSSTWQYGYRTTLASTGFTRYGSASLWYGANSWSPNGYLPAVIHNGTNSTVSGDDGVILQTNEVLAHPGGSGEYSIIRWTAPAGGPPGGRMYAIHADWIGLGSSSTVDVHVLINGSSVYDGTLTGKGTTANTDSTFTLPFTLPAGTTVEFVVGDGGNGYSSDSTAVNATITEQLSSDVGMVYERNGNTHGVSALDGAHVVSFGHGTGHGGSISQTFDTVPGATYQVNYALAQMLAAGNDGQTMSVEAFEGNSARSLAPPVSNTLPSTQNQWDAGLVYTFTATSASTRLVFEDTTPHAAGTNTAWALDNVSLSMVTLPALLAGPEEYNGHTYYLVNQATWQGGENEAVARGGHLVTINDADEQDWVFSTFKNVGVIRHLWIGLYETGSEGNYVWISGQTPQPSYSRWYPGQPDNYGGTEAYVHMVANGYGGGVTGEWNDLASPVTLSLSDPFAAVVEVENAQPIVPGYANVWLAGHPSGTTARQTDSAPADSPKRAGITVVGGHDLIFTVAGGTSNGPSGPGLPPDGANIITHDEENSIASLTAPLTALVGVFLNDSVPSGDAPQAYLDYTTDVARNAAHYAPGLRQPFYIGDGMTADGFVQTFRVPAGATRLYLGALDAYDNHLNFGSFVVGITEAPPIDTIEPPPNLVSWWPGENTAWDVAGIGAGSMKNAAHNGMDAYGPGKVGRAFVFDGVDDHIQGRPTGISLVQELTIEAWINPTSTTGEREIISKRNDDNANISYTLFLRDGHLVYTSRMAGVDSELADTGTIATNQWTHVAMTESYTAGRKLYVNGTVVASAAGLPPVRPVTTGVLSIGAYVTTANPTATPGAPFAGSIDELSLFNRALSSTEIGFIVNVGAGGKDRADPARDYSPVANPNTPWKYGWIQPGPISPTYLEGGNPAQGGLFPKPAQMAGSFLAYMGPSQVIFNTSSTQRLVAGLLEVNPSQFVLNPAPDGSYAVLRWTAPSSGRFAVSATFAGAHANVPATSDVHVLHNSETLFDSVVNDFQGDGKSFTDTISVAAGDTVDWVVGANGTSSGDHTGLVASVTLIDHSPFQIPTLQNFKFTGTLMTGKTVLVNAVSAARKEYPTMTAQLQYSPTPWDESSWLDVPGDLMTPTGDLGFMLLVNTLPAGHFAFRIATSVAGVGDAYSAPTDMYDVLPPGSLIEMKVTAASDSDATGATTHRGDYIDYLVQFRNTGGAVVLPTSQFKIEAKIPTGTSYFSSSPAATPLKTGSAITGLSWPIMRNLNPVDMIFTFTAKAASDVISVANHGFDDGDTVELRASTTGTLPGGLREGVVYKVTSSTSNSLKLVEPGKTIPVKCTNPGSGTHTLRRESDTWQKRLFSVSVTDPTKAQDTPTPVINPVGSTIVSNVKMKRATGADIPAAAVTTTVVNPLRLTGAIRGDSQLKQGGIVNIDFTVTNGASYTATGTNLVVRAPAGLTILNGAAFVYSNGNTGGAPIDPMTKKQIPGYYAGKPNPYLEEDTLLNQLVTFNLGNMLGGSSLTCRVAFRIQYDWNPALPISFNNAIVSITRPGTGASARNPVTRTLPSPLTINVAAAPYDPRPALALTITQEAAGILPGNSAVAVVIDRNDMVAGSSPQRSVKQIVYRMTYRNYGNIRAEFVRMAVPLPANTTYVPGTAVVKLAPNDKNPTGTSAPAVVGPLLIFNLPYLERFGVLGYEKTLEFRVTVKSGLPTGMRIIQTGGSVTTRDLSIATQARHQLEAEVATPALMRYRSDGFTISNGSSISEVRHRCFYENTGTLPASGVEIRYAIPNGYKFVDAVFLNANGTKNVVKSLTISKPLIPTSGTVIFPVGTVNRSKLVKGVPVTGGGFAVVRLQVDPSNPPTSANNWRRDGVFTHTSTVPAPPRTPVRFAQYASQEETVKTSLAPAKLYVGVFGAAFYSPEDDPAKDDPNPANQRLITYQLLWGSNSNEPPGAGGMVFPIPANTTYVRHTPSIALTGGAGESGTYRAPGSQFGGANGQVSWGLSTATNTATTAFVTVRINDGFNGTIVSDEAYAGGDRTGKRYQLPGRTTVYAPGEPAASRLHRLSIDSVGSASFADRAARGAGCDKFIRRMESINSDSSWMNFSGTDAFTVAGNNAVLISLGGGKIVAAGGGNIVAAGGGNIVAAGGGNIVAAGGGNIVAGGGGNIVAAGGGNIVAAGGGNIFSGVTNIVAAGGGNIVAAGGGNFVHVDVPGRGMMSATDLYKSMAQIVAAGSGNIVAGGGGNLVDLKNAVVANDGAGLIGLDGASLVGMDGASFGTLRIEADGALKMIPPTMVEQVVQMRGPINAVVANDSAGLAEIAMAAAEGGVVVDSINMNVVRKPAILGQDAASILGQDAASILGQDAASILGQDAASILGQDAASILGQDAASLIGKHGAGFKGLSAPLSGGVGFGSGQR